MGDSCVCFVIAFRIDVVNAVTITSSKGSGSGCYYYVYKNASVQSTKPSGSLGIDYTYDCIKNDSSSNKKAYCVNWRLHFKSGNSNYSKYSGWDTNSKRAVIAGFIIRDVNKKYSNANQAYIMTAAVLNTFFSKYVKNSNSRNFYSNSTIKEIYDKAVKEYDNVVLSTKISAPSFSVPSNVMNYSSGSTYISDKITLSGLKKYVGESDDIVTYTLNGSASKGTISFCTKANGTGCNSSITLKDTNSDYSFYVKVTGADSSTTVKINANGSNKSTYPTTVLYKPTTSGLQYVIEQGDVDVKRSTSKSIQLTLPDTTNHKIVAYKVDEDGELLNGSSLEIYKDDTSVAGNLLASNSNGASTISYTSPITETSKDDFFKHTYYLVEKSSPDGYVLTSDSGTQVIYKYDSSIASATNTSKCYYSSENNATEADAERCNFSSYEYKCLASSGGDPVALSEDGNCNFDTGKTDSGTSGDTSGNTSEGATSSETDNTEGGTSSEETGTTTPTTPSVTYEKICYNNTTNKKVDDETFCSEKDKYIKVSKSSGTLSITKVNSKNSVKISKRAVTGDDEVAGASLKICDEASYNASKEKCTAAKTISDVEMSWTSGSSTVEFSGLKVGTYYIVENTAPSGYIIATTATKFSIDATGEVKTGNQTVKDNLIVIKNKLNNLTISKTDIATGNELPGAKISICTTYKDDDGNIKISADRDTGNCLPAILTDGSSATWTSTDKPKSVSGLPAGTYYLVEVTAPDGYSTAESVIFVMNSDGTLTDKNGNSLKDNKLIMKDEKVTEVKTGMQKLYIILSILFLVVVGGGSGFYFINDKGKKVPTFKIRGRKIKKLNY